MEQNKFNAKKNRTRYTSDFLVLYANGFAEYIEVHHSKLIDKYFSKKINSKKHLKQRILTKTKNKRSFNMTNIFNSFQSLRGKSTVLKHIKEFELYLQVKHYLTTLYSINFRLSSRLRLHPP